MNELKPCPFCGGEATLVLNAKRKIYGKDEYRTGVVACCNVCEARMFYGSEKLAIEAWNRRAVNATDTNVGNTISRQAAIDIVEFECGEWRGLAGTIVKAIEQLPSAQTEIIWCRDCKHYDGRYCHHKGYGDGYAHYTPPIKSEEGFCDWAKEREEE